LATLGLTQDMLDDWEDLNDQFELARNAQADAVAVRDEKTMERINKGNQLYGYVVTYCNFGKRIYEKTNPAKYNDYVIYKSGPGPGSLTAPVNLTFNYLTKTFSWDSVANATIYKLETAINDADFSEVYAGGENSAVLIPPHQGNNWFRVFAGNTNGLGPESDHILVQYYDPLPAPQNLTIHLDGTNNINVRCDVFPTAETYQIFQSTVNTGSPAGEFAFVIEIGSNSYWGIVETGKRCYFYMIAKNSFQESLPSANIYLDVPAAPAP